jgi:hypothetical protein
MPNHLRGELRKITRHFASHLRFLFLPRDGSTYF